MNILWYGAGMFPQICDPSALLTMHTILVIRQLYADAGRWPSARLLAAFLLGRSGPAHSGNCSMRNIGTHHIQPINSGHAVML